MFGRLARGANRRQGLDGERILEPVASAPPHLELLDALSEPSFQLGDSLHAAAALLFAQFRDLGLESAYLRIQVGVLGHRASVWKLDICDRRIMVGSSVPVFLQLS